MLTDDGVGDRIGNLFKGCNVIPQEIPKYGGVMKVASREALQNWTSTPLITRHPS